MTEAEIKAEIDKREVITRNELRRIIGGNTHARLLKWWSYVLETKDWAKLKKYACNKQQKPKKYFEVFKTLYEKDSRLREYGSRRSCRLLEKAYGIKLARNTILFYRDLLKSQQDKTRRRWKCCEKL